MCLGLYDVQSRTHFTCPLGILWTFCVKIRRRCVRCGTFEPTDLIWQRREKKAVTKQCWFVQMWTVLGELFCTRASLISQLTVTVKAEVWPCTQIHPFWRMGCARQGVKCRIRLFVYVSALAHHRPVSANGQQFSVSAGQFWAWSMRRDATSCILWLGSPHRSCWRREHKAWSIIHPPLPAQKLHVQHAHPSSHYSWRLWSKARWQQRKNMELLMAFYQCQVLSAAH